MISQCIILTDPSGITADPLFFAFGLSYVDPVDQRSSSVDCRSEKNRGFKPFLVNTKMYACNVSKITSEKDINEELDLSSTLSNTKSWIFKGIWCLEGRTCWQLRARRTWRFRNAGESYGLDTPKARWNCKNIYFPNEFAVFLPKLLTVTSEKDVEVPKCR